MPFRTFFKETKYTSTRFSHKGNIQSSTYTGLLYHLGFVLFLFVSAYGAESFLCIRYFFSFTVHQYNFLAFIAKKKKKKKKKKTIYVKEVQQIIISTQGTKNGIGIGWTIKVKRFTAFENTKVVDAIDLKMCRKPENLKFHPPCYNEISSVFHEWGIVWQKIGTLPCDKVQTCHIYLTISLG